MTTQYKPLGLAQVCDIRDEIEAADKLFDNPVALVLNQWRQRGFDPDDVRQAAEEALAELETKVRQQ